ncbi:hypothetical protein FB45DRAFT_872847 [Roridomyces roridus]|uniref:Uncharacterized protein n=1 Tax=Roridomyces roridus TaxID=1738132 RepID=A0AAD7BCU8_9AGAR|nr:hypothetical protein FB45DRAFT_872847 [Roridomyces roridus]
MASCLGQPPNDISRPIPVLNLNGCIKQTWSEPNHRECVKNGHQAKDCAKSNTPPKGPRDHQTQPWPSVADASAHLSGDLGGCIRGFSGIPRRMHPAVLAGQWTDASACPAARSAVRKELVFGGVLGPLGCRLSAWRCSINSPLSAWSHYGIHWNGWQYIQVNKVHADEPAWLETTLTDSSVSVNKIQAEAPAKVEIVFTDPSVPVEQMQTESSVSIKHMEADAPAPFKQMKTDWSVLVQEMGRTHPPCSEKRRRTLPSHPTDC